MSTIPTFLDPPVAPARPVLRVIQGGLAPVPPPVYRRRRLVAGAAAAVVAMLLVVGVATGFGFLLGAVEGGPVPTGSAATAPAGAGTGVAPGTDTVVVQPGDTLWTLARRIDPSGDVRATVDRLAEVNGGPQLSVGQELVLPAGAQVTR